MTTATKSNGKKSESKRTQQGPVMLCNEHQETIFDNELSIAADNYAKAVKEEKLWKEKKAKDKRELISQMKAKGHKTMRMGDDKVITYKYTEAKEDIILKDYKPKSPRRRGGRF